MGNTHVDVKRQGPTTRNPHVSPQNSPNQASVPPAPNPTTRKLGLGSARHDEAALVYRTLGRIARERGRYRASAEYFDAAIQHSSSVTKDVLPSLMADRGESLLLAGVSRPIMTIVREAESMGSTDWATNAYLSALRQRISLSAADTADLSTRLRCRPNAVARDVAVQLGMSLARLGINVRGAKLTLYRAEQAARRLGASNRVSLLEAARLSI